MDTRLDEVAGLTLGFLDRLDATGRSEAQVSKITRPDDC
jgi:hypothetical protein